MIPKQSHKKGRGKKGTPKTDKSREHISSTRGTSVGGQQRSSMATRPKGTPVIAPGGRNSRC